MISSSYNDVVNEPSETSNTKQDQLLILDLNGTLCSRIKTKVYVRPHADAFFDFIFKNYTVMVWSSAQARSVNLMCKIFSPNKPGLVWDRSHLNLSVQEFHRDTETVKNLEFVWNISDDFNARNTIVLDDTPSKLTHQPHNLMHMSTFDYSEFKWDEDLLKVKAYLEIVRYQTNVAHYMKEIPFDMNLRYGIPKRDQKNDVYVKIYVNGAWINKPKDQPKRKKPNKKQKARLALAAAQLDEEGKLKKAIITDKTVEDPVIPDQKIDKIPIQDRTPIQKKKKKSKKKKGKKTMNE